MTKPHDDWWFRLITGDVMKLTTHLLLDEAGAFLRLLLSYHSTGAPLPDDDRRLAAMVGCDVKHWQKIRPALEPLFMVHDGLWHSQYMTNELKRIEEIRKQCSMAGQKSGKVRRLKAGAL